PTAHSCATSDSPLPRPVPAGGGGASCRRRPVADHWPAHAVPAHERGRQQPARGKRRLRGTGERPRRGTRVWGIRSGDRGHGDRLQRSSRGLPRRSRQARASSCAHRDEAKETAPDPAAAGTAFRSARHGNARDGRCAAGSEPTGRRDSTGKRQGPGRRQLRRLGRRPYERSPHGRQRRPLPAWNGSATTVTLRINESATNDFVTILNSTTGEQLAALGSVRLGGDYAAQNVTAPGSTMTLTGSVVKVILGTPTGKALHQKNV